MSKYGHIEILRLPESFTGEPRLFAIPACGLSVNCFEQSNGVDNARNNNVAFMFVLTSLEYTCGRESA